MVGEQAFDILLGDGHRNADDHRQNTKDDDDPADRNGVEDIAVERENDPEESVQTCLARHDHRRGDSRGGD